jgi:hypothetical protein
LVPFDDFLREICALFPIDQGFIRISPKLVSLA